MTTSRAGGGSVGTAAGWMAPGGSDCPNTAGVTRRRPRTDDTQTNDGQYPLTKSGSPNGAQVSELLEHLAVAMTRHVRHLRQDAILVPPSIDELTTILVRCVQTRPAATPVEPVWTTGNRAAQDDQVVRRLLVTKAEAADLLGVSIRTVERLIAGGQLPLLHIERASRLRLADIEAYVDSLGAGEPRGRTETVKEP